MEKAPTSCANAPVPETSSRKRVTSLRDLPVRPVLLVFHFHHQNQPWAPVMWRPLLPRSLPRGAERLGGDSHGVGRAACGPADNSLRTFGAECKSPERRVGDKKISIGRGGKSECVERERRRRRGEGSEGKRRSGWADSWERLRHVVWNWPYERPPLCFTGLMLLWYFRDVQNTFDFIWDLKACINWCDDTFSRLKLW